MQACPYGELRLMPNSTAQIDITGSVEICDSNDQWKSIHNNQWDDQDVEVACNQLGFANNGTCDLSFINLFKRVIIIVDYHTEGTTGLWHRIISNLVYRP